jgi:hypothetical protein
MTITASNNELIFIDLRCMLNGELINSDKFSMTINDFKSFINGGQSTINQIEQILANKAKSN